VSDDIAIAVSSYDNELMAMECIKKKLFGVQFHPEAYLSQYGLKIVQNYITFCEDNNNG
jgi:anthranilate synthase component 2